MESIPKKVFLVTWRASCVKKCARREMTESVDGA